MPAEKTEAYPLAWPADWPRTRLQDQKLMATGNAVRTTTTPTRQELDRRKATLAVRQGTSHRLCL